MRTPKYHLYLTDEEYSRAMQALLSLKSKLICEGIYTDAVDELIVKLSKAKRKKVRIAEEIPNINMRVLKLLMWRIGLQTNSLFPKNEKIIILDNKM